MFFEGGPMEEITVTGSRSGWRDLLIDLDWLELLLEEQLDAEGKPTELEPGTVLLLKALKRAGVRA